MGKLKAASHSDSDRKYSIIKSNFWTETNILISSKSDQKKHREEDLNKKPCRCYIVTYISLCIQDKLGLTHFPLTWSEKQYNVTISTQPGRHPNLTSSLRKQTSKRRYYRLISIKRINYELWSLSLIV